MLISGHDQFGRKGLGYSTGPKILSNKSAKRHRKFTPSYLKFFLTNQLSCTVNSLQVISKTLMTHVPSLKSAVCKFKFNGLSW